jgi:hypothetical protein
VQFLANNPLFGCTTLHHQFGYTSIIKTSLKIEEALLSSPKILTDDERSVIFYTLHPICLAGSACLFSNSAVFLPSATVRTITPNPFGLMDCVF